MKKIIFPILIILTGIYLSNCKHKPNDIPTPKKDTTKTVPPPTGPSGPTGATGPVDIKDSVCFTEELMPLFNSSCAISVCHSNDDDNNPTTPYTPPGGVNLTSFQRLKATVSGTMLLQVIRDNGPLGMPPVGAAPRFTPGQIQLVQNWVNQGMKDGIDCNGPCDSSNFTYSGAVRPILDNACMGCHNSGSGTNLAGYANVKALVDNGKLYNSIFSSWLPNSPTPDKRMPKNSMMLPNCSIRIIKKWIDAGALDN